MNAERLHVIAKVLKVELSGPIQQMMQQLVGALQQAVSQPQQPTHQQEVDQHRTALYELLDASPTNDFGPAWRQAIKEMGIDDLIGVALKEGVEEIFQRNQITLQVAHTALTAIVQRMAEAHAAMEGMLGAFDKLNVGSEDLEEGDAEISILIPREFVKSHFGRLGGEFKELDKIFRVFPEVVTGKRPPFVVKTISTTDPVVVLAVGYVVANCVSKAITWLLTSYEKVLNIRLMQVKLAELEMPDDVVQGVNKEADTRMDKDIDALSDKLLDDYQVEDEGRKNELRIELRMSLKKIAGRIDRGFNIEVRVKPEELPEPEKDEDAKITEKREMYQAIQNSAKRLQYRKLEGEPILTLPEPDHDDE